MKKQLYGIAFIALSMNSLFAFDIRKMYNKHEEKSQWMFLENTIIEQKNDLKNFYWQHTDLLVPALLGLTAGYQYTKLDNTQTDVFAYLKEQCTPSNFYIAISAASATILATKALSCYLNYSINRDILADFLYNWELNRSLTPEEFHPIFDALTEIMDVQGQEVVLQHATEIMDHLTFIIMRHFEGRYKNALDTKAADALKDTKTVIDMIKSFSDIAKNIK